jgi:hypothetical protein
LNSLPTGSPGAYAFGSGTATLCSAITTPAAAHLATLAIQGIHGSPTDRA